MENKLAVLRKMEWGLRAGLVLSGISVAISQAGLAIAFLMISLTVWLYLVGATN